jgi:hypothetical protein
MDSSASSVNTRESFVRSFRRSWKLSRPFFRTKRRQPYGRHAKLCLNLTTVKKEDFDAALDYCKESYSGSVTDGTAKGVVRGGTPPPPYRKRRGAVASTAVDSPETPMEEYEEEEDMSNGISPPSEYSHMSGESASPKFYREDSHANEPAGGPLYNDAFEPAYTPIPATGYYAQPQLHYPHRESISPGHMVQPPQYDVHDRMMAQLEHRGRASAIHPSFSQSPEHHYSMSAPHMSNSHQVVSSSPAIMMPSPTRHTLSLEHPGNSPAYYYSNDYSTNAAAACTPRAYDPHPAYHSYAHGKHNGAQTMHPVSSSENGLPMLDNSYRAHNGMPGQASAAGPPPQLSLAGIRATGPVYETGHHF